MLKMWSQFCLSCFVMLELGVPNWVNQILLDSSWWVLSVKNMKVGMYYRFMPCLNYFVILSNLKKIHNLSLVYAKNVILILLVMFWPVVAGKNVKPLVSMLGVGFLILV